MVGTFKKVLGINQRDKNTDARILKIPPYPFFPERGFFYEDTREGLPDRSQIMGSQLTLSYFGIGVVGKEHGGNPVGDDPCFL